MKALKKFTINFASLADGEHLFDYQVDKKFLKHFETALVQEANIEVHLTMLKFFNSLELNFEISGTVLTPCDVCVEEFDFPIEGMEQIIVKIVNEIPSENDESNVIYLEESSNSINIAEMLYELIILSIPMRKVHPSDENGEPTCDPSILKYLEESQDNLAANEEAAKKDRVNPIWDELKKLK